MTENDASLTLPRFQALLAAYGARSECWPDSERNAASALLEISATARQLAREQQALDEWLAASAPPLSPDLLQRLNAISERRNVPLVVRQLRVQRMWALALGWAAAAAVGLWLGARSAGETVTFERASLDSQEAEEDMVYDENEQLAVYGSTLVGSEFP